MLSLQKGCLVMRTVATSPNALNYRPVVPRNIVLTELYDSCWRVRPEFLALRWAQREARR